MNLHKSFFSLQDLSESGWQQMCIHLPHGFNTLFEEVEITVACQVTWPNHVTIETPKLLHLRTNEKWIHQ